VLAIETLALEDVGEPDADEDAVGLLRHPHRFGEEGIVAVVGQVVARDVSGGGVLLHAVEQAHHPCWVDPRRTAALVAGFLGERADDSHPAGWGEWQHGVFVLQQRSAGECRTVSKLVVAFVQVVQCPSCSSCRAVGAPASWSCNQRRRRTQRLRCRFSRLHDL